MSMTRLLAVAPIVAALAAAGVYAGQRGAGENQAYEASVEMATWAATQSRPGESTWNSVREDVEQAVERVGGPVEHELLGLLHARRDDREDFIGTAQRHLQSALVARPSSGYTWASIAGLRYRQGRTDETFESVLRRAVEFGAMEPDVQRTVAHFGLAVWSEIGAQTRLAVERVVAAGMRRNPTEMLQISGRRGRLDVACRHANGNKSGAHHPWSKLCPSTEATQ